MLEPGLTRGAAGHALPISLARGLLLWLRRHRCTAGVEVKDSKSNKVSSTALHGIMPSAREIGLVQSLSADTWPLHRPRPTASK